MATKIDKQRATLELRNGQPNRARVIRLRNHGGLGETRSPVTTMTRRCVLGMPPSRVRVPGIINSNGHFLHVPNQPIIHFHGTSRGVCIKMNTENWILIYVCAVRVAFSRPPVVDFAKSGRTLGYRSLEKHCRHSSEPIRSCLRTASL